MNTTLTVVDVMAGLQSLGFRLSTDGLYLTLDGPTEALDERRCELIRHFKPQIIHHLTPCTADERESIQWADSDDAAADSALANEIAFWNAVEFVEPGTLDGYFESLPIAAEVFREIEYSNKRASDGVEPKAGPDQQTLKWKD